MKRSAIVILLGALALSCAWYLNGFKGEGQAAPHCEAAYVGNEVIHVCIIDIDGRPDMSITSGDIRIPRRYLSREVAKTGFNMTTLRRTCYEALTYSGRAFNTEWSYTASGECALVLQQHITIYGLDETEKR